MGQKLKNKQTIMARKRKGKVRVEEKIRKYPAWAYCNILGSSPGVRAVVARKFESAGRKSAEEWSEIFKKEGLT